MASRENTTAVDEVLRQLSRVRRRRVAYTLQRAFYILLAAVGAAATVITGVALLGGPWLFAAASTAAAAGLVIALAYAGRDVWRAFDRPRRVAFWVDRRAALAGRLATLVEVATRRPAPRFFPLLVEQNVERLGAWTPSRAVPRPVPLAALAAAIAGIAALSLVLLMAPQLAPNPIEVVYSDEPVGAVANAPTGVDGGRLVLAPIDARDEAASEPGAQPSLARGSGSSDRTPSTPSLQERLRQRLWGEAWERAREAAATARAGERVPSGSAREAPRSAGGATMPAGGLAKEPGRDRQEPQRQTAGETTGERGSGGTGRPDERLTQSDAGLSGDAAPGAGTGSSPDLFGPTMAKHRGSEAFELALDASARGHEPAPRPPSGETPPAAPDERPRLAPQQRAETAVPRMQVPPSYEAIVRTLFAHTEAVP